MPRPGPRPYVCEKKAWHSDRHKPTRGSLIQEIFRVASEIHSPETRKNKEWQEKLPVVVLKAEEIMYSKANSEAEYLDLGTLKDRANDAINAIIKRDDNAETGNFLQPCIEAALNLGCTPRRTLRSQRYNNLRCYLDIGTKEEKSPSERHYTINRTCFSYHANLSKSNGPNVMVHSGSQLAENRSSRMNECPGSNSYAVYPLYYLNQHQSHGPKQGSAATPNSCGVLCDLSLRLGLHFPPESNGVGTLKRNVQSERTCLDTALKRQKAGSGPSGAQLFRWQPKTLCSHLHGRMKSSGL